MILRNFSIGTLSGLTRNIINGIHACNIVDVFTIHNWQIQCKTRPRQVLKELINCLKKIDDESSKFSF